jgi:hypothetical protein
MVGSRSGNTRRVIGSALLFAAGAIPARIIRSAQRGPTLMPAHKQIVVSDRSLNALVTFYFPEMF